MKKILALLICTVILNGITNAQDTMYVHQQGGTITKIAVNKIDSIVFYNKTITATPIGTVTTPPLGTPTFGSITDQDGNSMKTVQIGTQTWLAENLKVTKYNDGTTIPFVTDANVWKFLSTGAQCIYNNDANEVSTYGRLYNWYTVSTGKLCPTGWHVSSNEEWITLKTYLITNGYSFDGNNTVGIISKAIASTTNWETSSTIGDIGNNPSQNNKSGFNAPPGGLRGLDGSYYGINSDGYWWSSTVDSHMTPYFWHLSNNNPLIDYDNAPVSGFSVRCLRN